MENNFNENLFQAIDTIITKRLEEVVFDETIQCSIVSRTSKDGNEYEVKNNSVIFKATAKDGEEYKAGDNVCVSILANSDERIILGRYTLEQEDALSYVDPFDKFVIDKAMLLIHDSDTNEQPVIELTNKQAMTYKEIELIPVNNQSSSLSGYDFMGLEFGINISGLSAITGGDWAIGVTLLDSSNNPLHTMHKYGPNEEHKISPYVLSSDEVYGNPYTLTSNFTQRKLFYFPNSLQLSKIHQIKLTIYQSGDFTVDSEATLTIENFQMTFGYDVNKYLDKPIHLYVEGEYNDVYSYVNSTQVNGLEKPDIHALLIDQKNKTIIKELPEGQSLRWYQYKINEPGDEYGGGYWKYIEGVNGFILPASRYTLDIDRPNSQIKVVLCEDKPSVNLNLEATETIIFDDKRNNKILDQNHNFLLPKADQNNQYIIYQDNDENQTIRFTYWVGDKWYYPINLDTNQPTNDSVWNWPTNESWLRDHYSADTTMVDTIAAVINLQEDINLRPQTPISYYQYKGEGNWQYININETEKTIIATSNPFAFINKKSELINGGNGIVQIVTSTNKTYFLQYDLGKLVNNQPITLMARPISGSWPEGEILSKISWKIINKGLIAGLSFAENEHEELKDELIIEQDGAEDINLSCYCYLQENYNINKSAGLDNIIECLVNDTYQASIELSFGELSTQGTNYSFKIEPIETNYLPNMENATQSFKAILTTSDGIELDASNYELEWNWEQSSSYYEKGFSEAIWEKNEEEFVQKQSETEALQKLLKSYILKQETNNCQITLQKEFSNKQISPTFSYTYDASDTEQKYPLQIEVTNSGDTYNIHILKATCKVNALYKNGDNSETRTVTLKALYPIKILYLTDIELGEYPKQLQVKGHFILDGSSDNTLITELSTPYAIGELEQEADYNVEWSLLNQETNIPYTIIQDSEDNNYYLNIKEKTFTSTVYPSTIMATWNNNNFYQQPLMLQMVKYDIDLANKWAGGIVTIDNTESTIMATAVGAGRKDTSTNLFTGVLMGEFSQGKKLLNGLYGFNQGINTFGIDAQTGNAYFKGKISADSGDIAGWNIGSFEDAKWNYTNSLSYLIELDTVDTNGALAYRTMMRASPDAPTDIAFGVKKYTDKNNGLYIGEWIFGVNHQGKLTAKDAEIEGDIIATRLTLKPGASIGIENVSGVDAAVNKLLSTKGYATTSDVSSAVSNRITQTQLNDAVKDFVTQDAVEGYIDGKLVTVVKDGDIVYTETGPDANGITTIISKRKVGVDSNNQNVFIESVTYKTTDTLITNIGSSSSSKFFAISTSGAMYASNAVISGKIYANGGEIAGWTIASQPTTGSNPYSGGIYSEFTVKATSSTAGITKDDKYRVGMKLPVYQSTGNYDSNLGDYAFYVTKNVGTSNVENLFGVSYKGKLFAKNAEVEGKITATSGKIANWNIKDDSLYAKGASGSGKYTIIKCDGSVTIAAGVPYDNTPDNTSGAKFQVYHDGTLVATAATITGTLTTADGSSLGGFWTDVNSIYKGNTTASSTTGLQVWKTDSPPTVFMSTGSTGDYTLGGRTGSGWCFGAYKDDTHSFGVTIEGGIYANYGYFSDWEFGEFVLNGNPYTGLMSRTRQSGETPYNTSAKFYSIMLTSRGISWVWYATETSTTILLVDTKTWMDIRGLFKS